MILISQLRCIFIELSLSYLSYTLRCFCFHKSCLSVLWRCHCTGCVTSSRQGGDMISQLRCIFIVAGDMVVWFGANSGDQGGF